MVPNDVLSKALEVKTLLGDGEKAVFKMLNIDKDEAGREDKTRPEVYALSNRKTVIDPFTGENKKTPRQIIIGNVIGQEQMTDPYGKTFFKPKTESVKFLHGYLTLGSEQNNTFQYVMRYPTNESNPFAKKMAMNARERTPIFRLVNDKNEIKNALLIEDLKYQAQKLIRETINASDLKVLAAKMNLHPDNRLHIRSYNPPAIEDIQGIKLELLRLVPLFARQIIAASGDTNSKLKVQILEGLSAGVLTFDEGAFRLLGAEDMKMFTPAPDVDKTDDLIKWFTTDKEGQEMYSKFTAEVRKALKVNPNK